MLCALSISPLNSELQEQLHSAEAPGVDWGTWIISDSTFVRPLRTIFTLHFHLEDTNLWLVCILQTGFVHGCCL